MRQLRGMGVYSRSVVTWSTKDQRKSNKAVDKTVRYLLDSGGDIILMAAVGGAWLSERLRRWSNKPAVGGSIPSPLNFP